MTIQECYDRLGGDVSEVMKRLPGLKFVEKFIAKFPDDPSFDTLCKAISSGNREEAFRAAHTLKGVCQNLGFGKLLASTETLTEALRPAADVLPAGTGSMLEDVRRDYEETVATIRAYLAEV